MKKAVAMILAVMMVLAFSATAFAAGGQLSLDQAKQTALDFAGARKYTILCVETFRCILDGFGRWNILNRGMTL